MPPEKTAEERALAAHAELSLLSSDVEANAALIAAGLSTVRAIAETPPAEIVSRSGGALGEARAAARLFSPTPALTPWSHSSRRLLGRGCRSIIHW